MTEELEQLLKNLKLKRVLKVYDEQLQAAEKGDISYSDFVAGLLRAQWHERQESALEWRIHRANLPERWSLETFPWSRQPGVNRKQMRTFAELDFVAKHENLVLTGPTGVGKTGLACGLLLKSFAERLPLSVRSRAGPVRRDVCLSGRPVDTPTAEPSGAPGRPPG
jgi:DNA replication protein DnaC